MRAPHAYFPHVDGLRAIAVLSVLIYHLKPSWLPGGFAGVDIFFVISGFIVSASVSSLDRVGLLKFIPYFYARRLQRIAPALIVCLLTTSVVSALLIPHAWLSDTHSRTGFFAFFGLSNFILAAATNDYFSPIAEYNPYTHTWSLGVEEQFYFVFPFLFFAWSFPAWRRTTVALFVVALVVSLGYSAWLGDTDKTLAFYMITSRFWQLAAGVLLFQIMRLSGRRFDIAEQSTPSWFSGAALASLALIAYSLFSSDPATFPFPGGIPAVCGALGLLGFLHGQSRSNVLMNVIASSPALFVGRISYSLYLWHWPVFVLFRWTVGLERIDHQVAATAIAFGLATASYYLVEKPVRRNAILRQLPRFAVVAIGLVCVTFSAKVVQRLGWSDDLPPLNAIGRSPEDWYPTRFDPAPRYPGCVVKRTQRSYRSGLVVTHFRDCAYPATGPRIFATGDSHVLAYTGLYKIYAMETGATVTVYNNGGCAFLPMRSESDACTDNSHATLEAIVAEVQPGDVVFLPSLRLPRYADQWIRYDDQDVRDAVLSASSVRGRIDATTRALDVVSSLSSKGAMVVFAAPLPIFRAPAFRCAHTYNSTNPICKDGTEISRDELESLRSPVIEAFKTVENAVTGVQTWDPFSIVCPSRTCSAFNQDGRPLFFDADHLSGYGNRLLAPSFAAFVNPPGRGKRSGEDMFVPVAR